MVQDSIGIVNQDIKIQKMLDVWFESLIEQLRNDQIAINCGTASKDKEEFYTRFVTKPADELLNDYRKIVTMNNIEKALKIYTEKLLGYNSKPVKVALHFADSKVYVFAIIENDDETAEDALLLSEAYVNSFYKDYGLHFTTTILEKDDNYTIPDHYKIYIG